jgi:hypothetical protein
MNIHFKKSHMLSAIASAAVLTGIFSVASAKKTSSQHLSRPVSKATVKGQKTALRISAASAQYIGFDAAEPLEQYADLIIVGSPVKDFLDRGHIVDRFPDGEIQSVATASDFKVEKTIKTPSDFVLPDSKVITVIEPGGLVDEGAGGKAKIEIEGYVDIKKNSKYILFLKKNLRGKYAVINMNLGKFNLDNTDPNDAGKEDKEKKEKLKKEILSKYADKLK